MGRSASVSCLLLGVLLCADTASGDSPTTARLEQGEVVVNAIPVPGFGIPRFTATGLSSLDLASLWQRISDCRNYAEFIPELDRIELLERAGSRTRCRLNVKMPFPFADLQSVLEYRSSGGNKARSIVFGMISGDYVRNEGRWHLRPYPRDPSKTLIRYTLHSVPKTSLPDATLAWGTRRAVHDMVAGLLGR